MRRGGAVIITDVGAEVSILEQVSTTELTIGLRNPTRRRLEAELLVPVPEGAVLRGFTFQGAGREIGKLAALVEALHTFDNKEVPIRYARCHADHQSDLYCPLAYHYRPFSTRYHERQIRAHVQKQLPDLMGGRAHLWL